MQAQKPRKQPQRPLGPIRQPQILAAAIELLREQGLWTVRVSDVARRAGASPGTVIYYFGTKDQLFAQAIAAADAAFYAGLRPELAQLESATARLARLIHRSSTSDWVLWVDLWAYARRHADMLTASIDFHRRWCATIADVIRYGQSRGEFGERDVEAIAVRFAAVSNGLAIRMVLDDCPAPRDQYLAMSIEAAALELGCDAEELRREVDAVPSGAALQPAVRETEEAA
jgi:AcrR family transcriptional regulator